MLKSIQAKYTGAINHGPVVGKVKLYVTPLYFFFFNFIFFTLAGPTTVTVFLWLCTFVFQAFRLLHVLTGM